MNYSSIFPGRVEDVQDASPKYRWQPVKTSHMQNAQCSGNTKNCFKTN